MEVSRSAASYRAKFIRKNDFHDTVYDICFIKK